MYKRQVVVSSVASCRIAATHSAPASSPSKLTASVRGFAADVGQQAGTKKLFAESMTFLSRHKPAFETADVLRKLRQNLLDEQVTLGETDRAVYLQLLHPVQAARCFLGAYPYHCDVLSLLNALGSSAATA